MPYPPKVVSMSEIPMREQVEKYLFRLRASLPFPCSAEATYFGCVPEAVLAWHRDGLFEATPNPGKASNLLQTMFQSPEVAASLAMLHICVESKQEYKDALDGQRGFEKVFWFRPPLYVPLPRNPVATPFFLNHDHPYGPVIREWFEQAYKLENEIQRAVKHIGIYQRLATTSTMVQYTWPELLNFVSFKRAAVPLPYNGREPLRTKAARMISPGDRAFVIDMLATAVMMPEQSPPLPAWVMFYTGDE